MGWARSAARRLRTVPLFYKVLLANTGVVVLGAVAGTLVTVWSARNLPGVSGLWLIAALAGVGTALSIMVNSVLLLTTMRPLRAIEQAARQVQRGDTSYRAPDDPLADDEMASVARAMNAMLDALDHDRAALAHSAAERERLAAQVLEAQEEERKRIARELHDQTGQTLTSLALALRVAENAADLPSTKQRIAAAREMVREAQEEIHRLSQELRPRTLDDLGLLPALRLAIQEWSRDLGLQISLDAAADLGRLPSVWETAIYRVVQEAITNTAKYAGAEHATVRLESDDEGILVTIEDDGRGFDVAATMADRHRGLGLFGMQERAVLAGGRIEVASVAGRGTTVRLWLPTPPVRLAEPEPVG